MDRFSKRLFALAFILFAGNVTAQVAPATSTGTIQFKKAAPAGNHVSPVNPSAASRIAPAGPGLGAIQPPPDAEAMVQAELKRLQKRRDAISAALAKVSANYSRLTHMPATGNACVDPDTTWNSRSGQSFACVGMTTCIARMSRWSSSRTNPCEPGVSIDSCVISDECKGGSLCNPAIKKCVRR